MTFTTGGRRPRGGMRGGTEAGSRGRNLAAAAAAILVAIPSAAHAYIGPGAGFAFLGSFLSILGGMLLAVVALLTFPARLVIARLRGRKALRRAAVRRLVIVGLDGLDPELASGWMREGKLPNFSALAAEGCFSPLRTSNPPISPVAWSSFITGSNPGKHNIFDFLKRDPRTCLPALSSASISPPRRRFRLGGLRIPFGKPRIALFRKGVPFWRILGEHGVPSVILKVPITFPPDRFRGMLLSGLCTPDLKGSQGTFAFYTSKPGDEGALTGGCRVQLSGEGPVYATDISGPEDPFGRCGDLKIPLMIAVDLERGAVKLKVAGRSYALAEGELSDWIPLVFRAPLGTRVRGIAQFFLKRVAPHLELYLSPVNIDPEHPSLPISHPRIFSVHLAKILGPFATLGLPQDTWALNEGVLTDEAFLTQAYRIQGRLEEIFFHSLRRLRKGVLCCVFDTTDAVQHEFWRAMSGDQPARKGRQAPPGPPVIEDLYRKMDGLVGRVRAELGPGDLMMVLSDHGFTLFRRGVNLNNWLFQNGYLALKGGASMCGEWFEGVDWEKTRAYGFGLSGIYLNLKGREARGTVSPAEAVTLKRELAGKLTGLRDEEGGDTAIAAVYDTAVVYSGPYIENGPDLIVGYRPGYRCSWDSVTGKITTAVFSDNNRAWSADHCIDHRFVPGVFFCSKSVKVKDPHIQDIAPTVLGLFGIAPPAFIDGRPLGVVVERGVRS
ncbi:MAG: alkaline phosphatase family protein [Chlamydiota bacterium]